MPAKSWFVSGVDHIRSPFTGMLPFSHHFLSGDFCNFINHQRNQIKLTLTSPLVLTDRRRLKIRLFNLSHTPHYLLNADWQPRSCSLHGVKKKKKRQRRYSGVWRWLCARWCLSVSVGLSSISQKHNGTLQESRIQSTYPSVLYLLFVIFCSLEVMVYVVMETHTAFPRLWHQYFLLHRCFLFNYSRKHGRAQYVRVIMVKPMFLNLCLTPGSVLHEQSLFPP